MKDYIKHLGSLAEDLVNTYDATLTEPEYLQTFEDVEDFFIKHNMQLAEPIGEKELQEVRLLRRQLRLIFADQGEKEAVEQLNSLLAETSVMPQLVANETGQGWHIEFSSGTMSSPGQRLKAESALGLSLLLEQYGKERLRECAADPCRDVFIDTSRNGSRRYCCERCANRHNIALYRARQQEQ